MVSSERKQASAGYIIGLFQDIENLTLWGANYINLLSEFMIKSRLDPNIVRDMTDAELEEKIKKESSITELSSPERQNIVNTIQSTRALIFKTYVKFKALEKELEELEAFDKDVDKGYNALVGSAGFNKKKLEEYIILMNRVIITGIVSDALLKSKDIFENLVS